MRLWLLRHTHAVPAEDESPAADARRALSPEGRAAAVELGKFFRRNAAMDAATACWHSPLLRARETAALFRRAAGLAARLREVAGLAPEDDPAAVASRLDRWAGGDLILVGHEPHLGALGTRLIRGRPGPVQFELKKGAVLALERGGDKHRKTGRRRWIVRWLLAPALLRDRGRREARA